MAPRRTTANASPSGNKLSYSFEVLNAPRADRGDIYHWLLSAGWAPVLGLIAISYLALNTLFAAMFVIVGGVENAEPGSFQDAFFFSVDTMATIGYGAMYPHSHGAHLLVTAESLTGLLFTAVVTGLVFVRFSRARGRVVFSRQVAVGPMDGVPAITIRLGNARRNRIYDVEMRLTYARTTRTAEGTVIYKTEDLKLVRSHAPTLMQSWMIVHRIDEQSPLHGVTPEQLEATSAELALAITGVDDTTLQPVHGRYTWEAQDIVYGARLADVLSETAEGNVRLDLARFHDLEPTAPTDTFPYPAK